MNDLIKGTSILREQNKRKVLSFVRQLGETSRQDLVEKLNVSKNTISLIVEEFIKEDVLVEVGVKEPGAKGRPKILIKLNKDGYKSIGVSISKTNIEYSLINYYGQILENKKYSNDGTDPVQTKEMLIDILRNLIQKENNLIGIGVGIPGIVDSEIKYVHLSTHLNWQDVSLNELDEFTVPIYVQNSVNMGAVGALNTEGENGKESSFYVRVSEGVGGAYIYNNVIINGANWTAGEIGHISIDPDGKECICGQKGCLELLINYKAFEEQLKLLGYSVSIYNEMFQFEQAAFESKKVTELIETYGTYLGKAIIQVIHLMNPNKVIIDTPYNIFDEFQQSCKKYLETHALSFPLQHTEIIFGKQRYNMSRGAALSAILNYEEYTF